MVQDEDSRATNDEQQYANDGRLEEGGELEAAPGADDEEMGHHDGRQQQQMPEANDQPTNVYITAVDMQGDASNEPHIANADQDENEDTEE